MSQTPLDRPKGWLDLMLDDDFKSDFNFQLLNAHRLVQLQQYWQVPDPPSLFNRDFLLSAAPFVFVQFYFRA